MKTFLCLLLLALTAYAETPPPDEDKILETEFDYTKGVILFDLTSAGRPLKLYLNLGADKSLLDEAVAQALGLAKSTVEQTGEQPLVVRYDTTIPSLQLGNFQFQNSPVRALEGFRKSFFDNSGVQSDGWLGVGCFKNYIIQINFNTHQFYILKRLTAHADPPVAVLPLTWSPFRKNSIPRLTIEDVQLDGHRVRAQLDANFTGTAALFPGQLSWMKMQPIPPPDGFYARSRVYDQSQYPVLDLHTSKPLLGRWRLKTQDPIYMAGKDVPLPDTDIALIFGNTFFGRSVVTFDFPNSKLIITRSAED